MALEAKWGAAMRSVPSAVLMERFRAACELAGGSKGGPDAGATGMSASAIASRCALLQMPSLHAELEALQRELRGSGASCGATGLTASVMPLAHCLQSAPGLCGTRCP
jgi:hypothetical protein